MLTEKQLRRVTYGLGGIVIALSLLLAIILLDLRWRRGATEQDSASSSQPPADGGVTFYDAGFRGNHAELLERLGELTPSERRRLQVHALARREDYAYAFERNPTWDTFHLPNKTVIDRKGRWIACAFEIPDFVENRNLDGAVLSVVLNAQPVGATDGFMLRRVQDAIENIGSQCTWEAEDGFLFRLHVREQSGGGWSGEAFVAVDREAFDQLPGAPQIEAPKFELEDWDEFIEADVNQVFWQVYEYIDVEWDVRRGLRTWKSLTVRVSGDEDVSQRAAYAFGSRRARMANVLAPDVFRLAERSMSSGEPQELVVRGALLSVMAEPIPEREGDWVCQISVANANYLQSSD